MSVTFVTNHPIEGWRLDCAFSPQVYATHPEVLAAVVAHGNCVCASAVEWMLSNDRYDRDVMAAATAELGFPPDYCEMGVMSTPVTSDRSLELNMSNRNAAELLALLGFVDSHESDEHSPFPADDVWLAGEVSGDDLLGRVLVAMAVAPGDPGLESYTISSPNSATLIDLGRRPGYVAEKLSQIAEIAQRAIDDDVTVTWS